MNKYEIASIALALALSSEILTLAVLSYFGMKLTAKVLALAAEGGV
jgi:hypothetical protein